MTEEQARINRIALTDQLANFAGAEIVGDVYELRYDLSGVTGKDAELVVDVDIHDEATPTYRVKNLRIETVVADGVLVE